MSRNFAELDVWRDGSELAIDIFKLWENLDNRGYFGLQDQMQRAAVSIPSNIAEGSERRSAVEFMRYLYIAKGSVAELRTQLNIFQSLKIADGSHVEDFVERTDKLSRKIQRLISVISANKPK